MLVAEMTTEPIFGAGERRFRALIENISDAVALLNRQGKIIYSGPSTTRILGYEIGQNIGRNAFLLVHPEDRPAAVERFRALLESPGASAPIKDRLLHRDGSWRHVEGIATNLLDESGVRCVVLTYRDVTERIAAEAALRESEERYRAVIAALDEGIIVQGPDGTITALNESACRILGASHEQLIGRTSPDGQLRIVHTNGSTFPPAQYPAMIALATGQPQTGVILGIERPDKTHTWLSVNARPLFRNGATTPYAAVTSFSDITERKRTEAQLMRAARYDALTDLPNRSLFMERLVRVFKRVRRGEWQGFALLFLDFDHFKAVNDSLGHAAGDHVLVAIARRLEDAIRPKEGVARLGGDEFAVLMRTTGGPAEATTMAVRLHQAFAAPFTVCGHAISMTASIGVALSGPEYGDAEEMLRDADAAMYRAKEQGRGQYAMAGAEMHPSMQGIPIGTGDARRDSVQADAARHA